MPDSKKLIGKVDALLGKHHPAAASTAPPSDVPLLTDIVELPGKNAPAPDLEAPHLTEEETRLRDAILADLAPVLERRLSDTLKPRAAELLDWATQTIQQELQASIKAAVRTAVAKAVVEAISHRRDEGAAHDPLQPPSGWK